MNKTVWVVVLVLVLAVVVGYTARRQSHSPSATATPSSSPTNEILTPSASASPTAKASAGPVMTGHKTVPVTYSNGAVSSSSVAVKVGDAVTFVNNDSVSHWPASGVHPAHNICPGFDALRGLARGETYSFTFTVAKTCPFHDHLNAGSSSLKGQIVVTQ